MYCSCYSNTEGVTPPVSIKDWWVGPREQVLNVPIACWWHVPSKPSSSLSTEVWLKITASFVGLWEKLGTDPQIDRPTCWRLCREPFFSGAVALSNIVDDLMKGCHVRGLLAGSIRVVYRDWREKHTWCVYQISPVGCTTIQIFVTLRYEYPLVCGRQHVAN